MPNTSNDLQLPAPIAVLSSVKLASAPNGPRAANFCNNWLLANGGCTPLVDHGWQGTAFTWAGAAQVGPTFRVPTISGGHLVVDVVVNFTKTVGAGTITVNSLGAGDTVAVAAPVGGPGEVTCAGLIVDPDYDDIELVVTSAAGQITVHDVMIIPVALANPLPAAAIDGAAPMGVDSLDVEMPEGARTHRDWLTNLPILRQRRRAVAIWSGLDPAVGQETLRTGIRHRTLCRTWHGSVAKGVVYQAHAYVRNTSGSAKRLIWQVGALDWETARNIVPVANGFTGWKTTTLTLPDEALLPGYPWEACSVGLDMGIGAYPTTCEVLRYSVWGE